MGRLMLRSRNKVLATLVSASVVVTAALAWFGWRNLQQERFLQSQQARDRAESGAGAFEALLRGRIAETGERLSSWVSSGGMTLPREAGGVVFTAGGGRAAVSPPGGLPFVPAVPDQSPEPLDQASFARAEALEFASTDLPGAARLYLLLSRGAESASTAKPHAPGYLPGHFPAQADPASAAG
jgi:hypothetical protein